MSGNISSCREHFILATFNLRCPVDPPPHTWEERKSRCRQLITGNSLDIFGVQEAHRCQLEDLVLSGEYLFCGKGRNDFRDDGEFAAILYRKSRFALLDSGTFSLSETPHIPGVRSWESCHPRIASWGVFQDLQSNKKFVFYNTHLDNRSEKARINGLGVILEHVQKSFSGLPLALTGDFNSSPDSLTYKKASSFLFDAGTISRTPHAGSKNSFHAYGTKARDYPIDYIFLSKEFEVFCHRTVNTRFPEGFASDHYPVVAELCIR